MVIIYSCIIRDNIFNEHLLSAVITSFNCTVEILPRPTAHLIDSFTSKSDLIEVLLGSCNIPFYFNGNWPCVKVRGKNILKGSILLTATVLLCTAIEHTYLTRHFFSYCYPLYSSHFPRFLPSPTS